MERGYFILLLSLIVISNVTAGSVGISPAYATEHFEANLEKTFTFRTFNSEKTEGIKIELEGDLSKYANLSTDYIQGTGIFTVTLKLPEKINKPGTHTLYVKVSESKNDSSSKIGGIAAIRAPIRILVPYPGKYTESTFKINNINEGEDSRYELDIQNLGTDDVTVDTLVEIFKVNENGKKVLTKKLDDMPLKSKNALKIVEDLDTNNFESGIYFAKATVSYGKIEILNTTFRIGEFTVDIIDYDYLFEKNKINKFNIEIENKWNTKIESIYADVTITDDGKVVSTFKTISIDTNPWEIKNMTGFFDTGKLESKRYLANINLFYGDSNTHKLAAIYVQDPPKERNYLQYALIGVAILSLIMIIGFAILIIKIKKLRGEVKQNGKKK
ncbi:hypothetical protein KAS08_00870 [Candidatus Pacearchaeota archaeon]|nr:hypothetical protein [Candidatus Pacearchaeota archaeon]